MAPVFIKASIQAILGGPNRKPVYKVTRKHDDPRWHWGHTMPQTLVLLTICFTAIYALRNGTLPSLVLLVPVVYWGGLNMALFAGFVARSWYGALSLRGAIAPVLGARGSASTFSSENAGSPARGALQSSGTLNTLATDAVPEP
jgi:hypothetical protein